MAGQMAQFHALRRPAFQIADQRIDDSCTGECRIAFGQCCC